MTTTFSEPVVSAAPRKVPLHNAGSEFRTHRFLSGFFRWASDGPGRRFRNPLPSPLARLAFWTVQHQLRTRLAPYEVNWPLSPFRRCSWGTLLYWSRLLDEYRPEPWAPAILHMEVLGETVAV